MKVRHPSSCSCVSAKLSEFTLHNPQWKQIPAFLSGIIHQCCYKATFIPPSPPSGEEEDAKKRSKMLHDFRAIPTPSPILML